MTKHKLAAILILLITLPAYIQLLAGSLVIQHFLGPFLAGFFGICGMVCIAANLYMIKELLK